MAIRKLNAVVVFAVVALLMAASVQTLAHDSGNRVRLEAQLVPTPADPSAQGDAKFQSDSYDTQLEGGSLPVRPHRCRPSGGLGNLGLTR